MRTLVLILALLFPLSLPAQTVTATKWQDYAPLLDRQSKKINEHTAAIAALQAELSATQDALASVIVNYNLFLRATLIQVCYTNSKIEQWKLSLLGLRATPIGPHTCPQNLDTVQFYVPQYIGSGPAVPK